MLRPLSAPQPAPCLLREALEAQPGHLQASPAVRLESGVPVISSSRRRRGRSGSGSGTGSSAPLGRPPGSGELLFVYCPPTGGRAAASIRGGAVGGGAGRGWAAALVCPQVLRTLPAGARHFIAGGISGEAAQGCAGEILARATPPDSCPVHV
jgi:hypothetical protein